MKKVTIILVEVLFAVGVAYSQQVRIAPFIEKTVAGNQYGTQLLFQTKNKWNFGGFYQTSLQHSSEGIQSANPFFGIAVSAPLVKSEKINFQFNTRCGIVNQLFVVVVPGLETELKVSKTISLSTLMSIRMSYPSALLKFNITI
jgi:hypothetical protein